MGNNTCYLCGNKKLKLVADQDWPIKKCRKCHLIQVNPLPSIKQVNTLYRGDYWKSLSSYGKQFLTHEKYFQKKINEIKKYKLSGRLLDIGCALGSLLKIAQKEGFKGEGLDISDFAVKQCRSFGLSATQGVISNIKKKRYYDIITAFEVIEHELDPILTIKTIYSLLKKNGLFVMTVPNSGTLIGKIMGSKWFGYRNKEHIFHFTFETLRLVLKKSGFRDINITTDINRQYLFTHYLDRFNFYLIKSKTLKKFIDFLKKIPFVNSLVVPFNPWSNIIVYAYKK
ncbi:MAG: methyltransferase type 11 [uncultured bacterium]|nr:MAG: methyltransferase type 11 [uncultured bacterium]